MPFRYFLPLCLYRRENQFLTKNSLACRICVFRNSIDNKSLLHETTSCFFIFVNLSSYVFKVYTRIYCNKIIFLKTILSSAVWVSKPVQQISKINTFLQIFFIWQLAHLHLNVFWHGCLIKLSRGNFFDRYSFCDSFAFAFNLHVIFQWLIHKCCGIRYTVPTAWWRKLQSWHRT